MTTLQEQARALGDPTRHEIFRHVADATESLDVAELTDRIGVHHNAVRQHLTKLVEAELVVQDTLPSRGRGRPRLCYSLHPSAASRWGVTGPYERLSLLLSEVIRTGDSPVEVGRRAARRHRLGTAAAPHPVDAFVAQMAREGFEPTVDVRGDTVEVVLGCCPFATTALADPDTVCGLHLGMAYGAAEQSGGLVVDELLPEDPRHAGCRLRCHLVEESVA
ncbi:MAG: helix-turn-helix domain-containing protein [Acidimicrobiia bacterium]|nr:helix-turn-helix domain-containing protein [Acidimicrobiia bacterium]